MDTVERGRADTGDAAGPDAGLGSAPSANDILTPEMDAALTEKSGQLLMFLTEMALNGGNAGAAAERVGWTAQYGRLIVSRHPGVREHLLKYHKSNAEETLLSWKDLRDKAVKKLNRLLDESKDDQVLIRCIELVIERAEGKVTQRLDANVSVSQVSVQSVLMKFVASLNMTQGIPIAEALEYAQSNPEIVDEWGRMTQLLLPAGPPPA